MSYLILEMHVDIGQCVGSFITDITKSSSVSSQKNPSINASCDHCEPVHSTNPIILFPSCAVPSSSKAYDLARAYNLLVYGSSSGIIADAFLSVYDAHNISSDGARPGSRDDFSGRFLSHQFKRSLEERGVKRFFDRSDDEGLKIIVDAAIAEVMPKSTKLIA